MNEVTFSSVLHPFFLGDHPVGSTLDLALSHGRETRPNCPLLFLPLKLASIILPTRQDKGSKSGVAQAARDALKMP